MYAANFKLESIQDWIFTSCIKRSTKRKKKYLVRAGFVLAINCFVVQSANHYTTRSKEFQAKFYKPD